MVEKKLTIKEKKKLEKREDKKKLKEWSKTVRDKDGNKCVICQTDKFIHAHHLFPKEIKELRYDLKNGLSLCAKNHKFSREISAHNNPLAFYIWFVENRKVQFNYLKRKWKKIIKNKK